MTRRSINTKLISKSGKSVDANDLEDLKAPAKWDPRMKTEGDAVGIRRNEPRCCQLTGTTWIEHVTCISFLFTLHYMKLPWSEGTAFCQSCSIRERSDRLDLPDNRESVFRGVVPAIDDDVFHPRYTDLCCGKYWRI